MPTGRALADRIDPAALAAARWFPAKGRGIVAIDVVDAIPVGAAGLLAVLDIRLTDGTTVTVPLPVGPEGLAGSGGGGPLGADALESEPWLGLVGLAREGASARGRVTMLTGHPGPAAASIGPTAVGDSPPSVRPIGRDQSNTTAVVGESIAVKLYRSLDPGPSPEAELLAALADLPARDGEPAIPVPAYLGRVDLERPGRPTTTIALVQAYVADGVDEFEETADEVAGWVAAGATLEEHPAGDAIVGVVPWRLVDVAGRAAAATAALHRALARLDGPGRSPLAATSETAARWASTADSAIDRAIGVLDSAAPDLAAELRSARPALRAGLGPLAGVAEAPPGHDGPLLTRIHGDLHLGQLLRVGDRDLVIDFEGDPVRSPDDRRAVDSPLRDVATMLRSIDHVGRSAGRRAAERSGMSRVSADAAATSWIEAARAHCIAVYGEQRGARLSTAELALVRAFEIEKECGEFVYAARFLPAWLYAPTGGLRWLAGTEGGR